MTLSALLSEIRSQECVPFATEMSLERMPTFEPGLVRAITEEIYWYYLEVLPPHWMSGSLFAFAEGVEPLTLFWQERGDAYFAVRLTAKQSTDFCNLAGIVLC